MKKNSFLVKVSSFFMSIFIALSCISAIPVYAMETQEDVSEENLTLIATGKPENGVITIDTAAATSSVTTISYATTTPMGTFTCYGDNLTPTKYLASDSQIHRLVVKVQFRKSIKDKGNGNIRLDMYFRRSGSTTNIPMGIQSVEGSNISSSTMISSTLQTNWITVSPGESFQLFFDVCSQNASDATTVSRVAEIDQYWVYCD